MIGDARVEVSGEVGIGHPNPVLYDPNGNSTDSSLMLRGRWLSRAESTRMLEGLEDPLQRPP